jgi:Uma2 family endonuclease
MADPLLATPMLPPTAVFGVVVDRIGPLRAAAFEAWEVDPDNPMELVEGWVVPMSPGDFVMGQRVPQLFAALASLVAERGWEMSTDARHRLPAPADTVVFPDLALHCTGDVELLGGTRTVARVPDLVIELLSPETAERDRAPHGAKFLAYQMCGVAEYYYAWPDGGEASGFRRQGGRFVAIEPDAEGFFHSPLLAARLRLVEAAVVAAG